MKPLVTDYLIIGSGIAGLSFALEAATAGRVVILTKKKDRESNTNYAQGGIASAISPNDSPEMHWEDTLRAGAGLCDAHAARILAEEAPAAIARLMQHGVRFTRQIASGKTPPLDLGKEGGHSRNRIVHTADSTGKEIERALLRKISRNRKITILENHTVVDLITEHQLGKAKSGKPIRCYGAYALQEKSKRVRVFLAKAVMLATGGVGQAYQHTTNPAIATGDGIAMAYRAGASVTNLEFMQFHPTTLYEPSREGAFLISEALRGYGAELRTPKGSLLMKGKHPLQSLAPRDVVARAVDAEIKRSGHPCMFLDVTHMPSRKTRKHFPGIYKRCLQSGINITREWIPVVPAAHYMCGGVVVDTEGRSSISGLFACGETACTGVHGANRLASNSLLEAVVFSQRAFHASVQHLKRKRPPASAIPEWDDSGTVDTEEWIVLSHDRQEIRQLLWDYVGIVRTNHRLRWAQRRIRLIANEIEEFYRRTRVSTELVELRNIATVAKLIVDSSIRRKESRGLHFNLDYPGPDNRRWKRNTRLRHS